MPYSELWKRREMFWPINTKSISAEFFKISDLTEVLYEFNGPRIFITTTTALLFIWYECAEDICNGSRRYLVAPANELLISQLKDGSRTVYDALSQPWLWAVDVNGNDITSGAWVLPSLEAVPHDAKPAKDTPLWPHLEPILSYRLVGQGLSEGNIPASVIARAMEQPTSALKRLLEMISNSVTQGRPQESFRKAYDLTARRFAYNSFEVSFGTTMNDLPLLESEQSSYIYKACAENLSTAVAWINNPEDKTLDLNLLEVLKDLAPPANGQIEKAELRGQLIRQIYPLVLTRNDRQKISQAIRQQLSIERHIQKWEGRIGAFDRDNLTFTIRNREEPEAELICSFKEEQFDDLIEAFHSNIHIHIVFRQLAAGRKAELIDFELLSDAALSANHSDQSSLLSQTSLLPQANNSDNDS